MHSVDDALQLAAAMVDQFDSYLLSKEVFWPLGETFPSGLALPKLSLGQLVLTLDELRVQAEAMAPEQAQRLADLQRTFDQKRRERPANLEKKAVAEIRQRLNLWKAYLGELRIASAASSYANDVRQRVLLTRLQEFLPEGDELRTLHSQLKTLDGRLRVVFRAGEFVWHPGLRDLYDPQRFWFLYGRPVGPSR